MSNKKITDFPELLLPSITGNELLFATSVDSSFNLKIDTLKSAILTSIGNVFQDGPVLNNQIAVWSGTGTIKGTTGLTWNNSVFSINGSIQLLGGTGDQGTLSWNADEETVDIIQNGAVLQIGQETHIHCRNNTGVLIPNGTPVMATGTLGASGRITIAPMNGTIQSNVKYLLGITTEDIEADTDGKVTEFGKIRGLNCSGSLYGETWNDGDVLWIDTSTVGALTNIEPVSGMGVPVAFVISNHASNGTIMVRVTPLDEHLYSLDGHTHTVSDILNIQEINSIKETGTTISFGSGSASTGDDSLIIGINSADNVSPVDSIILGNNSADGISLSGSVYIGDRAGLSLVSKGAITNMVVIGSNAGMVSSGNHFSSVLIGKAAAGGGNATSINSIIAIGQDSLSQITTGSANIGIGRSAAISLSSGFQNIIIGNSTLPRLTTGQKNVCIGYSAGTSVSSDTIGSIIIGYFAGPTQVENVSNKLYINNNQSDTPLIEGFFLGHPSGPSVILNGSLSITNNLSLPTGSGINFSENSNNAGMTSELLDDYEEGVVTVTAQGSTSGTISLHSNFNKLYYTKVGQKVTVTGMLSVLSASSPVGTLQINNLPFTCLFGALSENDTAAAVHISGTASPAPSSSSGIIFDGGNVLHCYFFDGTNLVGAGPYIQSGTAIYISATYLTGE